MPIKHFPIGCSHTPIHPTSDTLKTIPDLVSITFDDFNLLYGDGDQVMTSEQQVIESEADTNIQIYYININTLLYILRLISQSSRELKIQESIQQSLINILEEEENPDRSTNNQTFLNEVTTIVETIESFISKESNIHLLKSLQDEIKEFTDTLLISEETKNHSIKTRLYNDILNKIDQHPIITQFRMEGYDEDDIDKIEEILSLLDQINQKINRAISNKKAEDFQNLSKQSDEESSEKFLNEIRDYLLQNNIEFINFLMLSADSLIATKIYGMSLINIGKILGLETQPIKSSIWKVLEVIYNTTTSYEIDSFIAELKNYMKEQNINTLKKFQQHDFTQFHNDLKRILVIRYFLINDGRQINYKTIWTILKKSKETILDKNSIYNPETIEEYRASIRDTVRNSETHPLEIVMNPVNTIYKTKFNGENIYTIGQKLGYKSPTNREILLRTIEDIYEINLEEIIKVFIQELKNFIVESDIQTANEMNTLDFTVRFPFDINTKKLSFLFPELRAVKKHLAERVFESIVNFDQNTYRLILQRKYY